MTEKKSIDMEAVNREIMRHIVSQNNKLINKTDWLEREVNRIKEFIKITYSGGNLNV